MARDLIITDGPSKDGLRDAIFEPSQRRRCVTFTIHEPGHRDRLVNVLINSLHRAGTALRNSGHRCVFVGVVVNGRGATNREVRGAYEPHLRVGSMDIQEVAA